LHHSPRAAQSGACLKKYTQHLLGWPINVRTDHAALTYMMKMPKPLSQQGRWLDLLGEYDITIQLRPGQVHGNSDALSRCPCEWSSETDCQQCPRATQTPAAMPILCNALPADGPTALPAPLHFLLLHSQPDKPSDLSYHHPPIDIAPDLLEAQELPVSPNEAAHASPTNDVTARIQVFGVTTSLHPLAWMRSTKPNPLTITSSRSSKP